jgi:hypothetical protein
MRFLIFILLFSFSLSSQAQRVCSGVYKFNTRKDWRIQSDILFKKYLVGQSEKGEYELYFTWSMAYPLRLEKVDESTYRMVRKGDPRDNYSNNPDPDSPSPLRVLHRLFGVKLHENDIFFQEIYKNYGGRIDPMIVKMIGDVEKTIETVADSRQELGLVATNYPEQGGRILGTMRFFNGTVSHSATPSFFPLEYAFALRDIPIKFSKKIRTIQRRDPKILMYEIGKFSLEGAPAERDRARALLELFWVQNYIDSVPSNSLFFAHVATEAHLRLYQKRYGFRIFETVEISRDPPKNEYILVATAGELRKAFEKLYPLPSVDFTVLRRR